MTKKGFTSNDGAKLFWKGFCTGWPHPCSVPTAKYNYFHKYFELTKEEEEILKAVEVGEFKRVKNFEQAKKDAIEAAKNTVKKNKNINLRISERDLLKLKAKAIEEGIPYQTLAASILHKYASQ